MKIIFSRKGYDSAAGGCASPIFPDGSYCSLPIPRVDKNGPSLHDLDKRLGCMVDDLLKSSEAGSPVHLDPDLNPKTCKRKQGWRPCFGQKDSSQKHLENHKIGEGDLFLFFGWFKEVLMENGHYCYKPGAPDLHCLWGWLQIAKTIALPGGLKDVPEWAEDHPHVRNAHTDKYKKNNVLYLSREKLALPGVPLVLPGGGVFGRLRPGLTLTAPGRPRSHWRLPRWFAPSEHRQALSFHKNPERWEQSGNEVILHTVGRGQEFVIDCGNVPEALPWIANLFAG